MKYATIASLLVAGAAASTQPACIEDAYTAKRAGFYISGFKFDLTNAAVPTDEAHGRLSFQLDNYALQQHDDTSLCYADSEISQFNSQSYKDCTLAKISGGTDNPDSVVAEQGVESEFTFNWDTKMLNVTQQWSCTMPGDTLDNYRITLIAQTQVNDTQCQQTEAGASCAFDQAIAYPFAISAVA